MSKSRTWCFTYFPEYQDHTEDELIGIIQAFEELGTTYLIAGKESCPTTDRIHLQGYVRFRNARRLSFIKRHVSDRLTLNIAGGSAQQNKTYCSKGGDYYESGTIPKQGKRSDLAKAYAIAKAGGSIHDYLESDNPTWQGLQGFHRLAAVVSMKDMAGKKTGNKEVHWYYGASGSGKTYYARVNNPDAWVSPAAGNLRWFDGYIGQKVAIFDEFHPDHFRKHVELAHRLLHPWDEAVEIKGATISWRPQKIYICSLFSPQDFAKQVYSDDNAARQLLRRVTSVTRFECNGNAYTRHPEPLA